MKAKIIGVVIAAIVVVAAVVVVFGTGAFTTPYWETETEFGVWQTEITIEFADGTTESLKIIQERAGKPFAVWYLNKEITYIGLKISAKATGEGYDGAELKYFNNFGITKYIKKGGQTLYGVPYVKPDKTLEIAFDDTVVILRAGIYIKTLTDDDPEKYPSGGYTVEFYPTGDVQYRGYPDIGIDNPWKTASLPPSRAVVINVVQTPTGQVVVTLSSEIEYFEA